MQEIFGSVEIVKEFMKKFIIIFSGAILFLPSCQKEYSYEGGPIANGPEPVSYIFEGAGDSCLEYVVNGKYVEGQDLSIENTVNLKVNVLDTGYYNIQTKNLDGISFSKSGRFNSTGSQQVILEGKGKPLKTGTYLFTIGDGTLACPFVVNVTPAEEPASYNLDTNSDGSCSSYGVPGAIYHGSPLYKISMIITVNVLSPGDYNISTNTLNGITFSQTGKFTTKGLQKVQLTARGTPEDIGVFIFTPYILIDGYPVGKGCNVDVYVF